MKQKTYIMLGRTGDIINILPAVEYESQQNGYKPRVVAAKEYADVLDGCSYLEKVIFDGDFRDIFEAVAFAQNKSPNDEIINCAVYGKGLSYKKKCHSFLREAWHKTKCPIAWGHLPLTFDNRDKERESKLLYELGAEEGKKIIITALAGTSSPLKYTGEILNALRGMSSDYQLIDISDYRAERMYDLLTLYEIAHCLIAIDSAPLHLAHATPNLPVISLISDLKDEWHRSSWRENHILRVLYSEVPNRLDEIIQAASQGWKLKRPKIFYLTTHRITDATTERRVRFASQSLDNEARAYSGRWYHNNIEETRGKLPRVKELIHAVVLRTILFADAADNDIIMISNADINFVPGITGMILHEVERHGAVYFHRHDFNHLTKHLISEAEVSEGKWYCGSDAFAFSKKWWNDNRDIFPDMYFAREAWDMVMRNMIKRSGGVELHNAIYHESHKSFWSENRNCPENLHNRKLADAWLSKYGGNWNDWKFTTQQLKGMYK